MNEIQEKKLKTLPSAPGVYFHKNKAGEIIYVGKAAVLKNRVRQYYQHPKNRDPKTAALIEEIFTTDWIVVDTEMDALFLESEMIKRYMPKWNILLRDDKTVSYVRIDMNSEIPYVSMTRQPLGDDARYIGPFYAKNTIATALRILRKIFPYYNKPYTGKKTLETDLGLTPGIEVGKMTPKEYHKILKNLIRYLEGDREELLKDLESEMKKEAAAGNFERAAELRNEFFGLKGLKKKIVFSDKEFLDISSDQALLQLKKLLDLPEPPRRIEGYDISHQSGQDVVASMVVFSNGAADRSEYRKFKLRAQKNDDTGSLKEVLTRRLKHQEWELPNLVILDGGTPQVSALLPLLEEQNIPVIGRDKSGDHSKSAPVKIVIPMKNPKISSADEISEKSSENPPKFKTVELAPDSHIARLIARIDEEAHRFAITYHTLLKRKRLLK
ncbi:GIY-YIG nuclease family protein [Candidatus Saccharibacteria bacterium]|nr:GIY-YIG nuclease family protein [Candidatus Saccharibacteria bacterium]